MTDKLAILNVADQGPLESLVVMLRSIGYECRLPDRQLRGELKGMGGLTLDIEGLVKGMGYERPFPLREAGPDLMKSCDLFVDLKAHQTYPALVKRWPRLEKRVLWYRINGAAPEHVIRRNDDGSVKEDCGDEANPPCPVLTPNQWYALRERAWSDRAYACWPPFVREGDYFPKRGRPWQFPGRNLPDGSTFGPPVCLIHNLKGWGYGDLAEGMRGLGVKMYGAGSPDGLVNHCDVPNLLANCLAYVHLKSNDAPGYALYEALAAGCPVICTRRLIWRCRMQELLIPGETCLVFDRETHDGLTPEDVEECLAEVGEHLRCLSYSCSFSHINRRIGLAGRERLLQVMWSPEKAEDVERLRRFMARNFPH